MCEADPLVHGRDVFGATRPRGTRCTIGAVERDVDRPVARLLQKSGELPPGARMLFEMFGMARRPPR